MDSTKRKSTAGLKKWFIMMGIAILCLVILALAPELGEKKYEADITRELIANAEEKGMKDVTVDLERQEFAGTVYYIADVKCSNFEEFSAKEMFEIDYDICPRARKIVFWGEKIGTIIGNIYSNGDKYEIKRLEKSREIFKNGICVYSENVKSDAIKDDASKGAIASNSEKDSYGHTKGDAIAIAEKEVKAQLKSPSTAKFSSISEMSVTLSGNTWRVAGWVDAQNGFGVTIRSSYTVTIEFVSSDKYSVKCSVS